MYTIAPTYTYMHYLCVEPINMGTQETETSLIGNYLAQEAGGSAGLRPELSVIGSPRINSIASTVATVRYP